MRSANSSDEGGGVEVLVREVARVEVDPEALAAADRVERLPRRDEVVRDLGRMHLEAEAHALGVEHVDDRAPALREVLRSRARSRRSRWAGTSRACARSAEPVKPFTWVTPSRAAARARVLHPLGGALPDALGIAVAPDLGREDRLVPCVDRVADGLADEVGADREAVQVVALEHLLDRAHVAVLRERPVDLEVVAPAGELEPVEAPLAGLARRAPRAAGRPTGR